MQRFVMFVWALLLAPLATAGDLTGAFIGSMTGQVENAQGAMVNPRTTIEATTHVTTDAAGRATGATVSGTASCTDGLGLTIVFFANYNATSGLLTGFYSDVPGSTNLTKPIAFTKGTDLTWTGSVSGQAPSATGKRAYELQLEITLPREALFVGTEYPAERSYSGTLNDTTTVQIPVSIPILGYNQMHSVTLNVNGAWTARGVPLPNGVRRVTGSVSGSFASQAPLHVELNVPGFGLRIFDVSITGNFGGTLIGNSDVEVAFIGAWTASVGDPNFGGDLLITVPINDLAHLKTIPYSYVGTISVNPGIAGAPAVSVPLNVSGSFPFVMN